MHNTVKAEGLIWLIVGVFWVIAQIAGSAAKKNQPRPPLADPGEAHKKPEDPIAELLRKMAGVEEFRAEPPEYAAEDEIENTFTHKFPHQPVHKTLGESGGFQTKTKNPWTPGEIEKLPDIKPLQRATPAPEPAFKPIAISAIDVRQKMNAFRQSVPSIKLPAMNLSFHGSETSVQNVPNLAKILNPADRNSIRRAMLSHIIFSPPKALEQNVK